MADPDQLEKRHKIKETFAKVKDSVIGKGKTRRRLLGGAVAGTLLLNACSSAPNNGAIPVSSFISDVFNTGHDINRNVTVGPVTQDDLTPPRTVHTSYTINGQKYIVDRLGGSPYLGILVPQKEQNEIFRRARPHELVFAPNSIDLKGRYKDITTDKKQHLGYLFLASGVIFSS
jgi:hypothetical protein